LPQALLLPLHCSLEADFATAVEASILTGGCTASRASIAGACRGALAGDGAAPEDWVSSASQSNLILKMASELVTLRDAVHASKM